MKRYILLLCLLPEFVFAQPRWAKTKIADFFRAQQILFVDSEVGYVAGVQTKYPNYEILYRTSDGGNSWSEIHPYGAEGDTAHLRELALFNFSVPTRKDIFIGTRANICSFDSGATWTGRIYDHEYYSNWHMFSAAEGYAELPSLGRIVKTYDSAISWDHVLNYNAANSIWADSLQGMYFLFDTLNNLTGYFDTIQGIGSGSTTDGGAHWSFGVQPCPTGLTPKACFGYFLHAGAIPNSKTIFGYAAGSTTALRVNVPAYSYLITSDLGSTWAADTFFRGRLLSMDAVGDGIILGVSSDTLTRYHPAEWLAMSEDGMHWDIDSITSKGLNINSIMFTDPSHGWAVGNDTSTIGAPFSDSTTAYVLKYIGPPLASVEHHRVPSAPALSVYPNPAGSFVHVQIASINPILRAEAVGVLGNSVDCPFQAVGRQAADIDISSLVPGVYELRLWTTNGSSFKPFVKLP